MASTNVNMNTIISRTHTQKYLYVLSVMQTCCIFLQNLVKVCKSLDKCKSIYLRINIV